MEIQPIAYIETDFKEKFGIPRQAGIVGQTRGRIVFLPKYRRPEALRGLEGYSHLWLIWEFSESVSPEWSPTVRPPRLGGNRRVGVFATRSPFRPNPIGLSSVRLLKIENDCSLLVEGADLLSGTPIYDVKPYIAYTDSHPDAVSGFADEVKGARLEVADPENLLGALPLQIRECVLALLAEDPRPGYQENAGREYGMRYAGYEIRFSVSGGTLRVLEIQKDKTESVHRPGAGRIG